MSSFEHVIHDENGIIAWRRGTGGNVELEYILVKNKGQGEGRRLVKAMLRALADNPPYATVYGFTRVKNSEARTFYLACGFELSHVDGVYDDGEAMVFSQRYDRLCKDLL